MAAGALAWMLYYRIALHWFLVPTIVLVANSGRLVRLYWMAKTAEDVCICGDRVLITRRPPMGRSKTRTFDLRQMSDIRVSFAPRAFRRDPREMVLGSV